VIKKMDAIQYRHHRIGSHGMSSEARKLGVAGCPRLIIRAKKLTFPSTGACAAVMRVGNADDLEYAQPSLHSHRRPVGFTTNSVDRRPQWWCSARCVVPVLPAVGKTSAHLDRCLISGVPQDRRHGVGARPASTRRSSLRQPSPALPNALVTARAASRTAHHAAMGGQGNAIDDKRS
jgi:hypothetical protein